MSGVSELERCMYGEVINCLLKICSKLNLAIAAEDDKVCTQVYQTSIYQAS